MAAGSHEVAWVAGLLECLPAVDVLSVQVDTDWLWFDARERVPLLRLRVHASGWESAQLLAEALRLREGDRRQHESVSTVWEYRTWSGWAAEGSREAAVWVEVTGGENAREVAA